MGGKGSGRRASALAEKKASGEIGRNARVSWRVITATLAEAARRLEKPESVADSAWHPDLPPANVIALAQWAVEMKDGKPTVKVDASVKENVTLDPSLVIKALREAQESSRAMLPERGLTSPTREESHSPDVIPIGHEGNVSDNSHCATSSMLDPIDAEYEVVGETVVGWTVEDPSRNVSTPSEFLPEKGG